MEGPLPIHVYCSRPTGERCMNMALASIIRPEEHLNLISSELVTRLGAAVYTTTTTTAWKGEGEGGTQQYQNQNQHQHQQHQQYQNQEQQQQQQYQYPPSSPQSISFCNRTLQISGFVDLEWVLEMNPGQMYYTRFFVVAEERDFPYDVTLSRHTAVAYGLIQA